MQNLLDRKSKFTNKEFDKLARSAEGDILALCDAFIWMTDSQVSKLSTDDSSRFEDYSEEMRCLMADAVAAFS